MESFEALIESNRDRIHDLDAAVIEIVQNRIRMVAEEQRIRIAAGMCRTDTRWEMQVITQFSKALGTPGRDIALSLLRLSDANPHGLVTRPSGADVEPSPAGGSAGG